MTVHRFYILDRLSPNASGRLSAEQARQAGKVLRLRPGDEIVVFDGTGSEYTGTLAEADRDGWEFATDEGRWPEREPRLRLTVGIALIRNERFELAVQKLTELGVTRIVPLAAERSVISYSDARRWHNRRARLERIVIEAAEQSERVTLPDLDAPLTVSEFLGRNAEMDIIALVERTGTTPLGAIRPGGQVALMIGPEGGWAPREVEQIGAAGATLANMGALILRAETAAIVAAGHLIIASATEGSSTS